MSLYGLKIALINAYATSPGADNVLALATALARAGHQVDIFSRDDRMQPSEPRPAPGVRNIRLSVGPSGPVGEHELLRGVAGLVAAIERELKRHGPYDLAHAHRLMSGLVAQRVKESTGLPYAVALDTLGLFTPAELCNHDPIEHLRVDIERRVIAHADRILAESPRQLDDLQRLYAVDSALASLVPPGVDTDLFSPRDRSQGRLELGLEAQDFVIIQIGRLTRHKGVDNAIRSLGRLGSGTHAKLLVVGGEAFAGTETARLAELARSVGVGAQVRFLGNRLQTELPHLLATADVLVDTPWFEPLGKSPVEAMACGTPPVVSDVGGASHTIVDGATGFLVRPRDPLGLAARLEQLHGNPALTRAMGRAGVARARTTFAWDHIAELLGVAYHRALDRALSDATRSWVLASPETANIFPVPLPGMGPIQELDEGFVRRRPFSRLGRADTRINSPIKSAARAN